MAASSQRNKEIQIHKSAIPHRGRTEPSKINFAENNKFAAPKEAIVRCFQFAEKIAITHAIPIYIRLFKLL